MALTFFGCSPSTPAPAPEEEGVEDVVRPVVKVGALTGPTMFGLAGVMEESALGTTGNEYILEKLAGTADELTAGLANGSIDIAAIPANLASVLYNGNGADIRLLATVNLGVLNIVETGEEIQSIEDLRGKTLYATGKGTTPEMVLNYILLQNGLDPELDLTIEYKTESAEVASLLASEGGIAMLPQPFVTVAMQNNDQIRIALDLTDEWAAVSEDGSGIVTGVIVGRAEFVDANPDAISAFLEEYKASSEFVMSDPQAAAALIGAYGFVSQEVAEAAIPHLNLHFSEGEEMKTLVSGYLSVLFGMDERSVGGALPDDTFYYAR